MNEKELWELWNHTSEESLIDILDHIGGAWRACAAVTLQAKELSTEGLLRVLRTLAWHDDERTWLGCFEAKLVTRTLSAEQVRSVLHMRNAHRLSEEVTRNLQRQLLGLGATADEVITLLHDHDSVWRRKGVGEFVTMKGVTFDHWERVLGSLDDKRCVDVASSLWEAFRARFPRPDYGTWFTLAPTCRRAMDAAVRCYLELKPQELAKSKDQVHLLYGAAGSVLNEPAYGGALWVRECLDETQQAKMRKKAEQLVAYAKKLEKMDKQKPKE